MASRLHIPSPELEQRELGFAKPKSVTPQRQLSLHTERISNALDAIVATDEMRKMASFMVEAGIAFAPAKVVPEQRARARAQN